MKKEKEEWGGKTGKEGLGKEESEQQRIKGSKGDGLEGVHQHDDENPFKYAKDEREKELEGKSFQIESFLEKLSS